MLCVLECRDIVHGAAAGVAEYVRSGRKYLPLPPHEIMVYNVIIKRALP